MAFNIMANCRPFSSSTRCSFSRSSYDVYEVKVVGGNGLRLADEVQQVLLHELELCEGVQDQGQPEFGSILSIEGQATSGGLPWA